jgi:nickel-dependent lactate racemase
VENHFATRKEDHVFFGETSNGVPVGVDRRFAEADLKIVTGLVEPHFMAGYSGGRKVVAPGVCHESTIRAFHSARFMGHAAARNLNLRANPLHEAQLAIIGLLSPVYAINVVIDESRRPSFINFGEIEASHDQAVAFAKPFFGVKVPHKFSTIVTSAAGSPLDMTYYQTIKGIVGIKEALAPGGRVFIAADCGEGLGSNDFRQSQKALIEMGVETFLKSINFKRMAAVDEWQTQKLTEILKLGDIVLYAPNLAPDDRKLTGVDHTKDLERAIADWVRQSGDHNVLVVPEGPYVIPFID